MVLSKQQKERKAFEKWSVPVLKKIQDILLLNDFHPLEIEPSEKDNTSECLVAYPYKSITVRYSNNLVQDWKKKKINDVLSVFVHEMCHPITDPLYCKAINRYAGKDEIEDERERLTDHFTNIIVKNVKII